MPALTHGRVVNGFNKYSKIYNSKLVKTKGGCSKKVYKPVGNIIPNKYINSNICSSSRCRRVNKNFQSKHKYNNMIYNISQRGIGDTLKKNILNKKYKNKCKLNYKLKKKKLCECIK
tara:strand:+ start:42 stop:392 length:351 start_codon:yes stop_codon:yes gene_type:complete